MGRAFHRTRGERGYSLIEVLMVTFLVGIVLTLSAGAFRNFWLTQGLHGAREDAVSELRQIQQRVLSESHPIVWGARFRVGESGWGVVEFNPNSSSTTSDDTCEQITPRTFGDGVRVQAASFAPVTGITNICRAQIAGASSDQFVFFFARNTATEGSLTLQNPSLPGKTVSFDVFPITGRVEEL